MDLEPKKRFQTYGRDARMLKPEPDIIISDVLKLIESFSDETLKYNIPTIMDYHRRIIKGSFEFPLDIPSQYLETDSQRMVYKLQLVESLKLLIKKSYI